MDPYYDPTSQHTSPPVAGRYSLSATTDPSLQYRSSEYRAYNTQQGQYIHPSSQYATMNPAQAYSHALADGRVAQYPVNNPPYDSSGQSLRALPFSYSPHAPHAQPEHGMYGGLPSVASRPFDHQNQSYPRGDGNAAMVYNGAAHGQSVAPTARYIPTPAQTVQYQHLQSRSPAQGSIVIPPSTAPSPGAERYPCDKCDRTFSRPHDRKRHFESQHMMTSHTCQYCRKEFSRADSLKRHLDNGCDKMPSS